MEVKKDRLIGSIIKYFLLAVAAPFALLSAGAYYLIQPGEAVSPYFFTYCGVSLLLIFAGAFLVGKLVTGPIEELSKTARELSRGNLSIGFATPRSDEIGDLQKSFMNFARVFRERDKMKSTFSRYISNYIADEILADLEVKSLAEYRDVTILFSDIRGFTTVSENLEPQSLFDILNRYFDQMIDIVFKYNGVINKFIGDAIMVIYNAPNFCEYSEIYAVITALEMNRSLKEFNARINQKYGVNLEIGIGINSGKVVTGNVGSEKRMEYTVIGDNVNISSRLQSIARAGEIVISENVARYARYVFTLKDMGDIELKGKRQPLRVHKVEGNLPYDEVKKNLKSGDAIVCQLSMFALGRIEKLSLETDLMPELKNPDEKIRVMALDLIIEKFRNKAEECIMFLLQNDKSEFVRNYAITQIGALGLQKFVNFLSQQYIACDSLPVRGAAIDCLFRLSDDKLKERIGKTCKFESEEIGREISGALAKHPSLNLYDTIERLISDDSTLQERKLGVYILCNLGLSPKVDLLNESFRSGNDEIRKLVVSAYLKIGTCKTVIFLLKNLDKFEKDTLNSAYKVIAHLLSKFNGPEYRYDIGVQIQLDIIKSLILSSDGKNFEKLKVALIKNR